jgi:hypothetical protein
LEAVNDEDSDETDDEDVVGGKSFVPPHERASQGGNSETVGMGDAGWRSLAS